MKIRTMVKRFFNREDVRHGVRQVTSITVVLTMLCVMAFAVDESATIAAAFQTGFQKIVTDSIGMLSAMVPIAVGFAGTLFIVKKAMSWFKGAAKG